MEVGRQVFAFFLATMVVTGTGTVPALAGTSGCGNGSVDPGEQCDDGLAGALGSCCEANCTIRAAGFPCFFSNLPCQALRTCSGVDAVCGAPPSVDGQFCQYKDQACLNGQCEEEPGLAFVGFTGATASAYSAQDIKSWTMDVSPLGTNEIAYAGFASAQDLFFVGDAAVSGSDVRLTGATNEVGGFWYGKLVPVLQDFTATFTFSITDLSSPGGIGDGFAFVIQRDMRGLDALADLGQDLGYGSFTGAGLTNSVAVEFDTYTNGEPAAPHVSVQTNFAAANSSAPTSSLGTVSFPALTDGATHTATIAYNSTNKELAVTLDSVPSLTVSLDLANLDLTRAACNDPSLTPRTGCLEAPVAGLGITRKGGGHDSMKWKWSNGPAFAKGDLGSPTATVDYDVCVYDGTEGLVAGAVLQGGEACSGKTCWKETGSGYKMKDKTGQYGGITGASISAGAAGKTKIGVKAKGPAFVAFPNGTPVAPLTAQLGTHGGGPCFSSTFQGGDILTNDGTKLKAAIK